MRNDVPLHCRSFQAFTLIEMMTATVIFTIILYVLTYALDATLGVAGRRSSGAETRADFRAVFESMRRDLDSAVVDRFTAHSFGNSVSDRLGKWVNDRKFLPMEINRSEGGGNGLMKNADRNFATLLFASLSSAASYQHPVRENLRMSKAQKGDFRQSPDALSEVCLVGYYVAYTQDSAQAQSRRSMKLYRHFRSGGLTYGDGHANGILALASDQLDPTSPRTTFQGKKFANANLPFFLSGRYSAPQLWEIKEVTQPWPKYPANLAAPPAAMNPPAFDRGSWLDPLHPIHNFTFGDEPVVNNVVEFKCVPYKKIEVSPGAVELFSTEQLNAYLGLANKEWPVLIKPDFIDVSLSVVGLDAALQMDKKEDWTLPPLTDTATGSLSGLDRLKRQHLKRFSLRIPVN